MSFTTMMINSFNLFLQFCFIKKECDITGGDLSEAQYPLIQLDGTPCSTTGKAHSSSCQPYTIKDSIFNQTGGTF